LLKGMQNFL